MVAVEIENPGGNPALEFGFEPRRVGDQLGGRGRSAGKFEHAHRFRGKDRGVPIRDTLDQGNVVVIGGEGDLCLILMSGGDLCEMICFPILRHVISLQILR